MNYLEIFVAENPEVLSITFVYKKSFKNNNQRNRKDNKNI